MIQTQKSCTFAHCILNEIYEKGEKMPIFVSYYNFLKRR